MQTEKAILFGDWSLVFLFHLAHSTHRRPTPEFQRIARQSRPETAPLCSRTLPRWADHLGPLTYPMPCPRTPLRGGWIHAPENGTQGQHLGDVR
jgi:hypothetical protein